MPRRRSPSTKAKVPMKMCSGCGNARNNCSCLEDMLIHQLAFHDLPAPIRELKFHPTRRWRSDLAWPERMLLVECEGGVGRGRHTSFVGFTADCVKYNTAALMGYTVLRFTSAQIRKGEAIAFLEDYFAKNS